MKVQYQFENPRLIKVLSVIFIIAVTIIIPVIIEFISFSLLIIRGHTDRPFLITRPNPQIRQEGNSGRTSYLDPHLGYAHDPESLIDLGIIPGFAIYGDNIDSSNISIRIITLGGSTTDPGHPRNWPKQLQEILDSTGNRAQVFNGGVSGYSTNQELLKLIRDCLHFDPDIIISLNGVNDLGFVHSNPKHPMVNPYQERLFKYLMGWDGGDSWLLPNTVYIIKRLVSKAITRHVKSGNKSTTDYHRVTGINYGPEIEMSPHQQWERNIRIMHSITKELRIDYLCFLQPILGFGSYTPTDKENETLSTLIKDKKKYNEQILAFYSNTKERCNQISYCYDLTDIFAEESGLFDDPRHPNAKGYYIIAKSIYDELRNRNLVK